MKKILSLALAILMLASLTVSASAASALEAGGSNTVGNLFGDRGTAVMKDLYSMISKSSLGRFDYLDGLYTSWYDVCPKCGGVAFHYVKSGKICWQCLESDCEATGTIAPSETAQKPEKEPVSRDEHCPDCGSDYFTTYLDTIVKDGKLVDRYFCGRCAAFFYVNSRDLEPAEGTKCPVSGCGKAAEFVSFTVENGRLYANYKCTKGHEFKLLVKNYETDEDELYRVKVICTSGGDYSVSGGAYAEYGQKKTIDFEPDKGYVLSEVVVNGESVSFRDNRITVTVKGNTTIRAYFEAQKSLKSYTITSTVKGGGRISALKNDVKTDPETVTAKATDVVTYRFTPSSKNYSVSDVKIDGKSVGRVSSYTFEKLRGDHRVEVTFRWNNPYADVKDSYLNAVEYVTEAGIMGVYKTVKTGAKTVRNFSGGTKISVRTFACALAELADVNDSLTTNDKRVEWAQKNGVIGSKWDLTATCDVQTACAMVKNYLEAIEALNGVRFKNVKSADTAKETALKIDLVTENGYTKNRDLNRYDLAAICYLIFNLPYSK